MAKKTNCVKRGKAYYRLTAVVGHKPDGKAIRKEFYGTCKSDAETQRDDYLNKLKNGMALDVDKVTVGQLMHIWMYEILLSSEKLKPTTYQRYEGIYRNYIKDDIIIAPLRVIDVKPLHMRRYYNALYAERKSQSQIKHLHKLYLRFFGYALDEGYCVKNPCSKLPLPGEKKMERAIEVFTDDEIRKIIQSSKDNRLYLLFILAISTGMRKGELLALRYQDIVDGVIYVRRSLADVTRVVSDSERVRELLIQEPKSRNSIRQIPLSSNLIEEIQNHKKRQAEERISLGLGKNEEDLIFTTATGNIIDPMNMTRAYKRMLKKADVAERKFHTFRHTYITKLILAGVPLPIVMELAGHSDISTTMIYTHVDLSDKQSAMDRFNSALPL